MTAALPAVACVRLLRDGGAETVNSTGAAYRLITILQTPTAR